MPLPKPTEIAPLTGTLDLRSTPDALPRDSVRMRQNLQTVGQGTLRRGSGFSKLLSLGNYNNSDFHDQMLAVSGATRQPITFLQQFESTNKIRSLWAATQSTIARLNVHSGAWRIYGSGFGGTQAEDGLAPRFKAASVGDYVLFTNNLDKVQYATLEAAPDPTTTELINPVTDLDVIGLSRAKVIWAWKSVIFLADVWMDGDHVPYRIVWGDFDNPLSFDPAKLESIAGFKDLPTNERILAGAPLGNSFLIYTDRSVWEMIAVGGDQSFDFRQLWTAELDNVKGVLAYPGTLTNMHDAHAYVATDGIYFFTQYNPVPQRPEYIHRASKDLFDTIDANACDSHIGQIYGDEIYFSIARVDAPAQLPDYTLRVNKTYGTCDIVDVGFSAMAEFAPQDIPTIRDFIIENDICTESGMAGLGYPYGTEGLPRASLVSSAPFTPQYIYTGIAKHIEPGDITVEDYDQPDSYTYSLCNLLGSESLDDICRTCKTAPLLVGAFSVDWCIKDIGKVYYRERCVNPTAANATTPDGYLATIGSYVLDPIVSILRLSPAYGANELLQLDRIQMDCVPAFQVSPLGVSLRVGVSGEPSDPNGETGMVWFQHSTQLLKYATSRSSAQHLAYGTQPTDTLHWNVFRQGKFIYMEFTINGVGGDALFSKLGAALQIVGETFNY
jgi:hypothetical protein